MTDDVLYVSAGRFSSHGSWIHPERVIDTCEIIYVTEGTVRLREGDEEYILGRGDVLRLDSGVPHRGTESSGEDERVAFYWAHYSGKVEGLPKCLRARDVYQLNLLFRQLLHYANTPEYPRTASDLVMRLLLHELYVLGLDENASGTALTSEIAEWIRVNKGRRLTAAGVAANFRYNKDYLTRLFARYYPSGIKEYIDTVKLNYIKEMLLYGDTPLAEIAADAGFDDYKYFLKYFKYHEGISPSEFRGAYFNTHTNDH